MIKLFQIVTPALLSFGPVFLAMPADRTSSISYVGAVMLALGLVLTHRVVNAQQREIEALREALGGPSAL